MLRLLSVYLLAAVAAWAQFGESADRAYTTLAADLDPTDTQITLTDGAAFPDAAYWVSICPDGECRLGATAANGETVYVTGKASTHVLNIAATGRQVLADGSGTSTGDGGNPTHSAGEYVVLTVVAAQWNAVAGALARAVSGSVTMTIDGAGAVIATGNKRYIRVPYAGTITRVTTLADQSCSVVVDVWKDTYANYPPTDADSITASAPPTLSSADKAQDGSLAGWTTSIAAGDILGFNVDSVSGCTWALIQLDIDKS